MGADRYDLVILGGGTGGVAAAMAAAEGGCRTLLVESSDWLGGQLTSQAVPPDEHPWIESTGCTRTYRWFRTLVRDIYRNERLLTPAARMNPVLNPGSGRVSALCFEPAVGVQAINRMLAPLIARGMLQVLTGWEARDCVMQGDVLRAVRLGCLTSDENREVTAGHFVDATELGDLLALCGLEYVCGAESRDETNEMHAPAFANPLDIQAFTWCAAISFDSGNSHEMPEPPGYQHWKNTVPRLEPALPFDDPVLTWKYVMPGIGGKLEGHEARLFNPKGMGPDAWNYRQILDPAHFMVENGLESATLVNWSQNDYFFGSIIDAPDRTFHEQSARELTLSLVYWLKTEAPRHDKGYGYPEIRLRGDLTGTADGLAKSPYIRESRRILSEQRITEGDIGLTQREFRPAREFKDTVGIGFYNIDLHPSCSGRNFVNLRTAPFQIPLGALLPRDCANLVMAAKNIGSTHITNGCYRLHPVEWNIGEAAGALVAYCRCHGLSATRVRNSADFLQDFQNCLVKRGMELYWPQSVVDEVLASSSLYLH